MHQLKFGSSDGRWRMKQSHRKLNDWMVLITDVSNDVNLPFQSVWMINFWWFSTINIQPACIQLYDQNVYAF